MLHGSGEAIIEHVLSLPTFIRAPNGRGCFIQISGTPAAELVRRETAALHHHPLPHTAGSMATNVARPAISMENLTAEHSVPSISVTDIGGKSSPVKIGSIAIPRQRIYYNTNNSFKFHAMFRLLMKRSYQVISNMI